MENFKKTLRHTDPMVLDDFGTSLPFIDVYLSTLDNQDSTIYKSVPAHWSWSSDFLSARPCRVLWESIGVDG